MSDRQQLRNLALEMLQAGSAMMKSGSEVLAESPPPVTDVYTRVRNELSSAALDIRGLRIDRVPLARRYEFFFGRVGEYYKIMNDDEVHEWAARGPGALFLKIETDFMEEAKKRERLETRPTSEGQEQGPWVREGGDSGESL